MQLEFQELRQSRKRGKKCTTKQNMIAADSISDTWHLAMHRGDLTASWA